MGRLRVVCIGTSDDRLERLRRSAPGVGPAPADPDVAPALVAVDVPAGTDRVVLRFHGYGDYPELLTLSGLTLAVFALGPMCERHKAPHAGGNQVAAR